MAKKHAYAVPNSSSASFPVGVEIEMTGAGWGYLRISLGEKTAEIRLSYAFDPFPELLDWLQAVATGDFPEEFYIDGEDELGKLVLRKFERNRLLFLVSGISETKLRDDRSRLGRESVIVGILDRNAILAEFRRELNGFFRNQQRFIPSEWWLLNDEEEDQNQLDQILGHPFLSKASGATSVK